MDILGKTRASVELRTAPNGPINDSVGPDCTVKILEEAGDWLKINPIGLNGAPDGYTPRLAIALPPQAEAVFPEIDGFPVAPRDLKAQTLLDWLNNTNQTPAWISADIWAQFDAAAQLMVRDGIVNALLARQLEWTDWLRDLQDSQRLGEATLDEWLVILQGGRNMWSLRPERIYKQPSQDMTNGAVGWIGEKDILLWTGKVRVNPNEKKYKTWYEVRLYKFRQELVGWYKADLLTEYLFPTPENDPDEADNAAKIFDLSQPMVRIPDDQEIQDAKSLKRNALQYIETFAVLNKKAIKYNLCGEFCAATLMGMNIIPMLQEWLASYLRARQILTDDVGTGVGDLQAMLDLRHLSYEMFQYSTSVSPIAPAELRQILHSGKKAIIGVGITRRGLLSPEGKIRHWVVLEDILPVGQGGWVRVYNPFWNQEEVYNYRTFIGSVGSCGMGLWIEPAKADGQPPLGLMNFRP